jgi:beta-glucosidase
VGYRGYERAGIKPLFPFGFGLSYTSFKYSDLKVNQLSDGQVEVAFTITNTGKKEAKEVAQVYVGEQQPIVVRPAKELKGFEKVSLRPGESKHVTVLLDRDAFMYYDVISESFRMQPGVFSIMVGRSSADIVLNADIKL